MEVDGPYVGLVSRERSDDLSCLEVPYLEGAALGPSAHKLLGPAEPHALDRSGVARQRL